MTARYQTPFRATVEPDYTRRPVVERRTHHMPALDPRWPGETVPCGGVGLCRECNREQEGSA